MPNIAADVAPVQLPKSEVETPEVLPKAPEVKEVAAEVAVAGSEEKSSETFAEENPVPDTKAKSSSQKVNRLVSSEVEAESIEAIKSLIKSVEKPLSDGLSFRSGVTMEQLVIEMIKPKLSDWLDVNLPGFNTPPPPDDKQNSVSPEDKKKEDDKAKILFLSKPKTQKFDVEEHEVSVDDLLKLNYETNKFPPEYYAAPFSKVNSHLPPVYFESYYTELAFKAVTKEDLGALRFFIDKYHLERNVDVDGNTLLIHAANQGKIDAARLLIMKKIDIDAVNLYGMTALHVAAIKGDYEMARLLLSMDADFSILDSSGKAALDYAEQNGYEDVIELFSSYYLSASRNHIMIHNGSKTKKDK
ncbi:unnamed protein product [Sphagnum compactum]